MRRDRVEIWADILLAVYRADRVRDRLPPTRIQSRVNVPHARFWKHVAEMESHGLLESTPLRMTKEGERFLKELRGMRAELERLRSEP